MRSATLARLRPASLLAVCLVLGAALSGRLGATALAQTPGQDYDIMDELAKAFQTEAGQQFTKQFEAGEAKVFTDPAGDFIHPTGPEPGFTPPYVDINEVIKTGKVMPGQDGSEFDRFFSSVTNGGPWCAPEGFGSNPEIKSICSPDWDGKPGPFGRGALAAGTLVGAPIPENPPAGGCEIGFWTYTPSIGPAYEASSSFPKDPADGMNQGLILRENAQGAWSMVNVRLNASGQFQPVPTRAVAAIYENQVAMIKPLQEIGNLTRAQYHVFCANGERTDPAVSGGDILGPVDVDLASLATVTFTGVAAPSASPSASASPATGPQAPGAVATGEESDLGWLYIVLVVVGIILFLVGLYLFLRLRKEPAEPPAPGDRSTPTPSTVSKPTADQVPTGPGDVPTTPMTVGAPPKTRQRDVCDWALYFEDGVFGRVRLRAAEGHECCVYVLRVATTVLQRGGATRGRQEPDRVSGGNVDTDERFRVPHLELESSGLDLKMGAGVRSGPAGTLEWMEGYGEPDGDASVQPYWQQRSHEEPPDVAAHFFYTEGTRVSSQLSSDCPEHVNSYTLTGWSGVKVNADEECTNRAPGDCPIEITAEGGGALAMVGPIQYQAGHMIGSSPDELERTASNLKPEGGFGDIQVTEPGQTLHKPQDHEPRAHYTGTDDELGDTKVQGDDISFDVLNSGLLDAGIIVPVQVWPATGRVTAWIESICQNDVVLAGRMKRTACAKGPCCGDKRCICKPAFDLVFEEGQATIKVDGATYPIERPGGPAKVGAEAVWVVQSP